MSRSLGLLPVSALLSLAAHGVVFAFVLWLLPERMMPRPGSDLLQVTISGPRRSAPSAGSPAQRRSANYAMQKAVPPMDPQGVSQEEGLVESQGAPTWQEYRPPPSYPVLARRRGWAGEVRLVIETDAQGIPERVSVLEGSGYPILDDAAIEAVKAWRTQPLAKLEVPIVFRLKE
jgi:TonB family protein